MATRKRRSKKGALWLLAMFVIGAGDVVGLTQTFSVGSW